jgi:RNA-directed DNA polymerase
MPGAPTLDSISTKLQRIAKLAREMPDTAFFSLAHHIDIEFLREAYRRTRKGGAVGVDGQTAATYAENLDENLTSLLNRFKTGTYRAPPVKRVHIPKGDGKTRPIGIPAFEDKVLQRAVTMVLEAVYEQDFLDFSYGFRPKRSAHQALEVLWKELMAVGGGWVLEVDIKAFFDTLVPDVLRTFLDQRVRDGVLRRVIGKWLKAGVMEDGCVTHPDLGTPQGGVVSPLLANIYLHEVLDKWFVRDVQPRLTGRASLIRYADDFVIVFSMESDARRVMKVLPERFGKYGLTVHPDKTRLIPFLKPSRAPGHSSGSGSVPGVFDLLGFTHFWGRTQKGGRAVTRNTAKSRFKRGCKAIDEWCRSNRHQKVSKQHQTLSQKLRGHFQYYGITGNYRALNRFRNETEKTWKKWLTRRSEKKRMSWDKFARLKERYPLPATKVVQSIYRPQRMRVSGSRMP